MKNFGGWSAKDIAKEVDDAVDGMWDEMEDAEEVEVEFSDKLVETKLGDAYELAFKFGEDDAKGEVQLYIVHGKWDPARIVFDVEEPQYSYSPYSYRSSRTSTKTYKGTIEFEKLKINSTISSSKFRPSTRGYGKVDEDDIEELFEGLAGY